MESQEPVLSVGEAGVNTVSRVVNQAVCGCCSNCTGGGEPTLLKQDNSGEPSIIQIPEVYRRDAAFIVPGSYKYGVNVPGMSDD